MKPARHLIKGVFCTLLPVSGLLLSWWQLSGLAIAGEIDFGRQIRPILSDKCFQCHGADQGTRQADLRLDERAAATADRDGSRAIAPGDPGHSLLMERILSTDPDLQMPPQDANKTLTQQQKELLRQWIQQGAPYSEHWSFQPVSAVTVPALTNPWCRNEIDTFILQQLQAANITPSPEADRATLIRRLTQDLLGLLPTPAETAAFVNDTSADAYEKLVDRLLQSPHYGERWGRHWLDQARYADSHGFTIDGPRTMWPYRDWVIQAINNDLPFDQFTIEQLAGDLLPSPTKSQLVATGFHRNTLINQEGGVKPDQYRHEAVIDRVNTTATVWLGLTMGCAQCHSHKFDPISHDDYFRMYAFFNRCKDANNVATTEDVVQGEMFGLTEQQQAGLMQLNQLRKQLQVAEAKNKKASRGRYQDIDWAWNTAEIVDYTTAANGTFQLLPDGSLLSDQNGDANDTYRVALRPPRQDLTALRLRVLPHPSLPQHGPGLAGNGNFILTNLIVRLNGKPVVLESAWADHEQPAFPAQAAIDQDLKTGWAVNVGPDQKKQSPGPKMNAQHELIVLLATPLKLKDLQNELTVELFHGLNAGYLIGRFALDYSSVFVSEQQNRPRQELTDLKNRIHELESLVPGRGISEQQMVMEDLEQPPETYRLKRGDFLQPAKDEGPLSPGVPAALTGHLVQLPEFRNRLDLARWLVCRENPLTPRVAVNRVWMHYFGRGLVETENDFGFQGSPPSHPELLDWLAGQFIQNGWSMKRLHKTIVMSATYRQSSVDRPELHEVDPQNILLAKQARFRVEAETIRDQALCASGKFAPDIGGPSVFPPQPEGVYAFTQNKKNWTVSKGVNRYRRTLYTMFYRSAPYPLLTTFDSPDFNTACTQRPRSNTPLQSLSLANDQVFVELAQALARRLNDDLSAEVDFPARLTYLFQLCLSRDPTPREVALLEAFWHDELKHFSPDAASRYVADAARDLDSEAIREMAAWISTARVLMNTDEFVTRN